MPSTSDNFKFVRLLELESYQSKSPQPQRTTSSNKDKNNTLTNQKQLADEEKNEEIESEKEIHILCELIHFARNRSWKKKVLTVLIILTSALVLYDIFYLGNIQNMIHGF